MPLLGRGGRVIGLFGISRDISEKKRAERALAEQAQELARLSLHDELTGLLNRRGFLTLAEHELQRSQRTGDRLHLLFVDVDQLKQINDQLGHRAGDQALLEAAGALRSMVRSSDLVARIGGDEFCIMPLPPAEGIATILARLKKRLAELNAEPGRRYRLALSVGCTSMLAREGGSIDDLLTRADEAMYVEKRKKR